MFLGIDPGIRKLGYALIDEQQKIIDAGALVLDDTSPTRMDQFARMHEIYEFFEEFLDEHPVEGVAIEKLFFTKYNQRNAEFVYGIRGALGMLFRRHTIPIYEYTPNQLKKYIAGNGRANKELMLQVVTNIFQLSEQPKRHDTADALGLALLASRKQ